MGPRLLGDRHHRFGGLDIFMAAKKRAQAPGQPRIHNLKKRSPICFPFRYSDFELFGRKYLLRLFLDLWSVRILPCVQGVHFSRAGSWGYDLVCCDCF